MSKILLQRLKKKQTYIVAEIGINHNGDLNLAKKLIISAKKAGADAVKFQTYLTHNRAKKNSPVYKILKKCELPLKYFLILKKFSDKKKIDFFSTPFDIISARYLNKIGVNIIKISSFDISNKKFLKELSKFKNSFFIISTGMSKKSEIKNAIKILDKPKNKIILLHCISSYPNKEENSNLSCIKEIKSFFKGTVGLSDHTNDIFVPTLSVALGAKVIEKHFMINKQMTCVDKSVSITQHQMSDLVFQVRRVEKILGNNKLLLRKEEIGSKVFRRIT
jgi:N,N'-diacetyllegionaminate synthase